MIFQFNRKQVFIAIVAVFLCVQIIGIYTGYQYIQYIEAGVYEPIFEDPEDVSNSFILILYVLIMTAFILFIIRYKKVLLRVLEAIVIFFASDIVFEFGIASLPFENAASFAFIGMFLAFLLTAWKVLKPSLLSQDVALVFAVSGAGAIIGASFGVFPVLVFLLLLSIYDFVAVFYTKHMIYMAKAITERPLSFTAAFPFKDKIRVKTKRGYKKKMYKHVFQLGGGDLAIPLVFSVAVLNSYGFQSMLFTVAGSLIALMLLFSFILRKPGIALPALPPISAGACIGFAISLLI